MHIIIMIIFVVTDICFIQFQNRGDGLDMNVQGAWSEGVSGKGVVVTILDDGLEKDHPDLIKNYVSDLSVLYW